MHKKPKPVQSIKKRRIFELLFKKGKTKKGRLLDLWVYEGPEILAEYKTGPLFAIMISRKALAGAVQRNLLRRRIREAFKPLQFRIKPGIAILIRAKYGQSGIPSYEVVDTELRSLLGKIIF